MNEKRQKNWFERNWKWFVPTGGLTAILLLVLFIVGLFWGIISIMKSSDSYKYPMELVNQNEKIIDLLGSPIESTFIIQGSINTTGPTGNADLSIPVKGPKGKGILYVSAEKKAGSWEYKILEIEIKGETKRIKLLE